MASLHEHNLAYHFQEFLQHDDITLEPSSSTQMNGTTIYHNPMYSDIQHTAEKVKVSSTHYTESAYIKVSNLSASWSFNPEKLVLEDIHFEVNEVCGRGPIIENIETCAYNRSRPHISQGEPPPLPTPLYIAYLPFVGTIRTFI